MCPLKRLHFDFVLKSLLQNLITLSGACMYELQGFLSFSLSVKVLSAIVAQFYYKMATILQGLRT